MGTILARPLADGFAPWLIAAPFGNSNESISPTTAVTTNMAFHLNFVYIERRFLNKHSSEWKTTIY